MAERGSFFILKDLLWFLECSYFVPFLTWKERLNFCLQEGRLEAFFSIPLSRIKNPDIVYKTNVRRLWKLETGRRISQGFQDWKNGRVVCSLDFLFISYIPDWVTEKLQCGNVNGYKECPKESLCSLATGPGEWHSSNT